MDELLQLATQRLRTARSIAVLTGAGISAESGIPTFRDALTGLWAKFNPAELATPEAFARDPGRVSRWYDERRCRVAECRPNAGHLALARLEEIIRGETPSARPSPAPGLGRGAQTPSPQPSPGGRGGSIRGRGGAFTLITQNVDWLHQAAGSAGVIELHGSLRVWRCVACGREEEERGPAFAAYPPRCGCGGLRRPGVVWFGEALTVAALAAAEEAVAGCDYFLSIGTSAEVYPAAGLIEQALAARTPVLEVNPQATPFSTRADWSIRGKSGEVLPRIVDEAFGT